MKTPHKEREPGQYILYRKDPTRRAMGHHILHHPKIRRPPGQRNLSFTEPAKRETEREREIAGSTHLIIYREQEEGAGLTGLGDMGRKEEGVRQT